MVTAYGRTSLPPPGLEGVHSVGKNSKKPQKHTPLCPSSFCVMLPDSSSCSHEPRILGLQIRHYAMHLLASCRIWAGAVQSVVLNSGGVLHEAFQACTRTVTTNGRVKDILPLPLLARWPTTFYYVLLKHTGAEAALVLANLCLVSLNVQWD